MNHTLEIILYAIVIFLPFFCLELYAFRKSLRFSSRSAVAAVTGLTLLQIVLCLFSNRFANLRFFTIAATLVNWVGFLCSVRDILGKKLFMLLMIANNANLIIATAECVHYAVMPQYCAIPYHWSHSVMILLSEAFFLSPMFLYVRRVYAQSEDERRRMAAWKYLWLIPATFFGIWCILFQFNTMSVSDPDQRMQYWLVTTMLFISGIAVYAIVNQCIQEHVENEKLREREYLFTIQKTQYESLQERIEEARRAKHDLRHHIHLASAYLNDGMLEELRTYLQQFSDSIPDDARISYCDHYAANALLMYFSSQAGRAGVEYKVNVDLPLEIGIPDEAIVVVLGNLLENAIAACREEPSPTRLTIYGRVDDSVIFFKVSNTCSHPPRKNASGRYQTTKRGGQGLGLASVQNIAAQYEGIMEAGFKENIFTVSIMMTIPDA